MSPPSRTDRSRDDPPDIFYFSSINVAHTSQADRAGTSHELYIQEQDKDVLNVRGSLNSPVPPAAEQATI